MTATAATAAAAAVTMRYTERADGTVLAHRATRQCARVAKQTLLAAPSVDVLGAAELCATCCTNPDKDALVLTADIEAQDKAERAAAAAKPAKAAPVAGERKARRSKIEASAEQIARMRVLRAEGVSYVAIGEAVGLAACRNVIKALIEA